MSDQADAASDTEEECPGFDATANQLASGTRGCRPAPTCAAALNQATQRWPGRNRASDGICGDAAHAKRKSDHNPAADGFAHAFDLTHDTGKGLDTHRLADQLRQECKAGREKRVKYIISNRRIVSSQNGWAWRSYSRANPHVAHMHVSVTGAATHDASQWWAFLSGPAPKPEPPKPPPPPPHGRLHAPAVDLILHQGDNVNEPDGWLIVGADGGTFNYGAQPGIQGLPALDVRLKPNEAVVGGAPTPTGRGCWLAGRDGGVFALGDAPGFVDPAKMSFAGKLGPGRYITNITAHPSGRAVYLLQDDGGVITSPPDAQVPFFGSPG